MVVFLLTMEASAHQVGVSQSEFALEKNGTVRALLVLSEGDAARLAHMDRDRDGVVSPAELAASEPVFRDLMSKGVVVRADNAVCAQSLKWGGFTDQGGFALSMVFTCVADPRRVEVDLPILASLPAGHRHAIKLSARSEAGERMVQKLLTGSERSVSLVPAASPRASFARTLLAALKMGVEHILIGWDHLLFLAALLLGISGLRPVVAAVTAFTVAHSITLAVAALGVWAPSPRFVEPAIAASIAFVAFENALRAKVEHRWRLTFVFGLIHGFGFAGALRELALARERLVPTLLGFNLGVEVGQVAVLLLVIPVLWWLKGRQTFESRWLRPVSVGMGSIGLVLCVVRVVAP
jgi:hydrogenase/urease accessory protein HupE